MINQHIGSKFDDFLDEEGLMAETQAEASKRVIAWQIQEYSFATQASALTSRYSLFPVEGRQ